MADVFISYAHSTSKQAQSAAGALRAMGYSVWLDDDLASARAFTHAIEEQLTAARAALVIWSADAARSEWVLSEANRAREDHKLVQLVIDKTRLPMPFDQVQCADLAGWSGDGEHANWWRVIASLAALVVGENQLLTTSGRAAPKTSAEPLLAVLAFDNLSSDPEMAYFSDGISEEIQETVARGADLKVIGRASSFQFRGAQKAAANVAAELKATHVLDGSVRRNGDRLRVAAELIECDGQTTLWSDRFDRELSDVFALQDEIAAAVAAALRATFTAPAAAMTIDPAVYDLFLRAQSRLEFVDIGKAVETLNMLQQVVAAAPKFARAWALLAFGRAASLRVGGPLAARLGISPKSAREAAEVALELDDKSGAAHLALSFLEPFARFAEREAHIRTALEVAPNDPEVLVGLAWFSYEVGRRSLAIHYAERAYALDPLQAQVADSYAAMLTHGSDRGQTYQECRTIWESFRVRWPDHDGIAYDAIAAAVVNRDWAAYDALVEVLRLRLANSPEFRGLIWFARNFRDPDPQTLDRALIRLRQELGRSGVLPLSGLTSLSQLGMTSEVFELIEGASFANAFDATGPVSGIVTPGIIFAKVNATMMADIRFVGLCAKLGLCAYWVSSGRWPDCADAGALPYDFKAECRRLTGGCA